MQLNEASKVASVLYLNPSARTSCPKSGKSERTAMSKLITVFGATGNQGNAVARALLNKKYKVRAVTRNPDNGKAKELKELGAEIVQVKNMDVTKDLEKAIQGAYGVFCVTNFWGMLAENPETAFDREVSQGKAVGDVCKKLGVKHLVYSGLEHAEKIFGKPVPPFDSKGIVEKYLDDSGVPNTSTRYGFYYENFLSFPPQKNDDGTYTRNWPSQKPVDAVSASEGGPVIASIFDNPDEYIGKKVGLSSEKMTLAEYAAIISKVTGKTLKFNYVPPDVFAKFPFPGADYTAAACDFLDYQDGPDRNIELTRKLNPAISRFEEWATMNKDKFPWP